jgi:hypothetical protein
MSRRVLLLSWFATLLLLAMVAGFSWVDVALSPASGGQTIEVTGYLAFPVVSALVLLQGASLLAAVFTPALISKAIASVQIPILAWHLFVVLTSAGAALEQAVSAEITKATGVVGVSSQAQLVELALNNNLSYVYAAVLLINMGSIVALVLSKNAPVAASRVAKEDADAGELWESQS